MKIQRSRLVLFVAMILVFLLPANVIFVGKAYAARSIIFPVVGQASFSDDYNAPRASGPHHAIDILAKKGTPLVSAISGTVTDVQYPEPDWGWSVTVRDDDGYKYRYIHMNDDTPGTNDGNGGAMNAYAAYVKEGNRVTKGQLIGRVGDSGHSNGVSHLHFEMFNPNGDVINPYKSLVLAHRISKPVVPPKYKFEILPFGLEFSGGVSLAMGNIDGDVSSEVVVGAGAGAVPHVSLYEPNNVYIRTFTAYNTTFRGGIDVATGDVNNDGTDEIITGAGPGGGPHVKVFEPDGTLVKDFFAFDSAGRTGIRVAAGDVDNDGTDEIITSLQAGSTPTVRVFKIVAGNAVQIASFNAYSPDFRNGVDVAAGDVGGATTAAEIVTSTGPGSPNVKVFSGLGSFMTSFLAYKNDYRGGVRVSVGNVRTSSAKSEILTVGASQSRSELRMFSGTGSFLAYKLMLEPWWVGYYDVAAGNGTSRMGAGINRRVTVQVGL